MYNTSKEIAFFNVLVQKGNGAGRNGIVFAGLFAVFLPLLRFMRLETNGQSSKWSLRKTKGGVPWRTRGALIRFRRQKDNRSRFFEPMRSPLRKAENKAADKAP